MIELQPGDMIRRQTKSMSKHPAPLTRDVDKGERCFYSAAPLRVMVLSLPTREVRSVQRAEPYHPPHSNRPPIIFLPHYFDAFDINVTLIINKTATPEMTNKIT